MFIFTALQLLHYLNLLTLTTPLTPVPPELTSRDAHNMPCALRKPHCNGRVLTVTVIETIYYTITVSPTGPSASVAEDVVVVELPDVEIVEEKTEKVEEGDGVSWQRCEEYGLCDEL